MSLRMGMGASSFAGSRVAAARPAAAPAAPRARAVGAVRVDASRVCELTGARRNKANTVTFSNKHNRKWQEPNLQQKKVWWEAGQRFVKLRISARAIKTLEKVGLEPMAKDAGLDLWKLPFEDMRPERLAYLAENPRRVPTPKASHSRAMKNPERLAASKKQPKYPVYEEGGRIVWIRPGMEASVFGEAASASASAAASGQQREEGGPGELKVTISG
jgi:large subunit ribosomal protein L28